MSSPGRTYLPESSAINGLRSRERAHKSWTFLPAECIIQLKFPPQPNLRAPTSNEPCQKQCAGAGCFLLNLCPEAGDICSPETGNGWPSPPHKSTHRRFLPVPGVCISGFSPEDWDNGGGNIFRWKSSEGNFQAAVHWWQRWKWQPGSDKFKVFLHPLSSWSSCSRCSLFASPPVIFVHIDSREVVLSAGYKYPQRCSIGLKQNF